jgi:hypothetical protein
MEFDKRMLVITLAVVMSIGIGPAFADPSATGTNTATVTVTDAVSIIVTNNAAFGSLAANNIQSSAEPININSTSNVPIDVAVKAVNWDSTSGNMPLSALQFGTNTPMTTSDQSALTNIAPGNPGQGTSNDVNLFMQVPFGSKSQAYNTTVIWTATAHPV